MPEKTQLSEQDWKERLSSDQYKILRKKGTERAFTGKYWDAKDPGLYRCAACGNALFRSDTKYDSGTGWPSFAEPVGPDAVEFHTDRSMGMKRTEVTCAQCGGHLGHVFDDGPGEKGERYCMNSVSLDLDQAEA
jgi:peptide-methionine (R)-S-oxide reductase